MEDEYRKEVSDLGLIAALYSLGYQGDVFMQGQRAVYSFYWDDAMQELEDKYFSNDLEVDARTYQKNLRSLKREIVELKKGRV